AHLQDQCLNPLARLMLLTGNLLTARHDPFAAAEGDDHRAAFEAGDGAGDNRADAIFKFFVNAASLILADELDHDLLGGLGGDAPQDVQRDLIIVAPGANIAGAAFENHLELRGVFRVELLAQRGGDGLLDVDVDLLALDVLVSSNTVDD